MKQDWKYVANEQEVATGLGRIIVTTVHQLIGSYWPKHWNGEFTGYPDDLAPYVYRARHDLMAGS